MILNDLCVRRVVRVKYNPGNYIDIHKHDYYHYMYILNGKGRVLIEGKYYSAEEGELYLIPINVEHMVESSKDKSLETIDIKFISYNDQLIEKLDNLPHQIKDIGTAFKLLIKNIVNEVVKKDEYYQDMTNIKLSELIVHILRNYSNNDEGKGIKIDNYYEIECVENSFNGDSLDVFNKIRDYIKENICQKIEINTLAKMFGFTETYFCTFFRNRANMPPLQYIIMMKISKAKELLIQSELNISQISDMLGFDSLHYFSRLFRKKEGLSPQEYIKKMKGDVVENLLENTGKSTMKIYEYPQKRYSLE